MKRPVLNKVSLDDVINGLLSGKPSVAVTMNQGQWDRLLQAAYDAGHNLIEVDDCEVPVRAYRKRTDSWQHRMRCKRKGKQFAAIQYEPERERAIMKPYETRKAER